MKLDLTDKELQSMKPLKKQSRMDKGFLNLLEMDDLEEAVNGNSSEMTSEEELEEEEDKNSVIVVDTSSDEETEKPSNGTLSSPAELNGQPHEKEKCGPTAGLEESINWQEKAAIEPDQNSCGTYQSQQQAWAERLESDAKENNCVTKALDAVAGKSEVDISQPESRVSDQGYDTESKSPTSSDRQDEQESKLSTQASPKKDLTYKEPISPKMLQSAQCQHIESTLSSVAAQTVQYCQELVAVTSLSSQQVALPSIQARKTLLNTAETELEQVPEEQVTEFNAVVQHSPLTASTVPDESSQIKTVHVHEPEIKSPVPEKVTSTPKKRSSGSKIQDVIDMLRIKAASSSNTSPFPSAEKSNESGNGL
ncbi:hypothetical protein Ciccas_001184 [Cichlidogyrus casuarinus]|uniref:Uncharacterized protein n=1 Tax=Cichlidogyrus casuarinus TaxID=1844966 RepID=A0ABD2QLY7_9PLAT